MIPLTNYNFQIGDGTEPAIECLPILYKKKGIKKDDLRLLILLLLFNGWREIAVFAARGVVRYLWSINYEEAQLLFNAYLLLKPKYNHAIEEAYKENAKNSIYQITEKQVLAKFTEANKEDIEKIEKGLIKFDDITDIEIIDLEVLARAFDLIPDGSEDKIHIQFILYY